MTISASAPGLLILWAGCSCMVAAGESNDSTNACHFSLSCMQSALAYVPVVATIECKNLTAEPMPVIVLEGGVCGYVDWQWQSKTGQVVPITEDDYFLAIRVSRCPPRIVTLPPHESIAWRFIIPVPRDIGNEEEWSLCASFIGLSAGLRTLVERKVLVVIRESQTKELFESKNLEVLQAAIIQGPTYIGTLITPSLAKRVEAAARHNVPMCLLFQFAQALDDKTNVVSAWQRLDSAPDEARIVRNYRLLKACQSGPVPLGNRDRQWLLETLQRESGPFISELTNELKNPRNPAETVTKRMNVWPWTLLGVLISAIATVIVVLAGNIREIYRALRVRRG